ncbi:60S ribosomal protein L18a-3 [Acorus calamus]|uniref:60S ribosomal protein L18a-3 n=1 Tax=Acorus calamus TaxID=4465 RepID=A0AAV9E3R6_ACOCL|nr:60S ribosomal protein L18a-3 [Acorus calamus]
MRFPLSRSSATVELEVVEVMLVDQTWFFELSRRTRLSVFESFSSDDGELEMGVSLWLMSPGKCIDIEFGHENGVAFNGLPNAVAELMKVRGGGGANAGVGDDDTPLSHFHQYQVVGRALPTTSDEHPKIYRMKL